MPDIRVPYMDWSKPDRVSTFKLFKQKALMYFDCMDVRVEKQVSHILLMTGDEGVAMFNSWDLPDDKKKDPAKVWEKFELQIEPKSSFRVERLTFHRLKQRGDESCDDFLSRLINQAALCKFNDKDERIIEQITFGTKFSEIQKNILVQNENYTLNEAIEACRIYEASITYQQAFQTLQVSETNINAVGQKLTKPCSRCGEKKHRSQNGCPAKSATCHLCGVKGHWAKACTSKQNHKIQQGRNTSQHRYRHRSQSRDRRTAHANNDYKFVNAVDNCDDPSFAEVSFHSVNLMIGDIKQNSSATVTLNIKLPSRAGSDKLTLKVDTGAEGNLLPLRLYRRMFPSNLGAEGYPMPSKVTNQQHIALRAYDGNIIKHHGLTSIYCKSKLSDWKPLDFFVVESDGPALLGLASCKLLNVVQLQCDNIATQEVNPINTSINCIADLKLQFPRTFDTLGNFEHDYHITIDPAIPPVVHSCRKVPIQRRDAIKAEIDKMQDMGVIKREIEPTDWVSSVTFVDKKDGTLRVCLDPKDLNKALKRPHHRTPTLEDISHHFSGAKFFSKLDAKNGYWSIRLNEASSKLTTFITPFGRYRFLRLPFGLSISQDIFQQRMDAILEMCPGCTGIADDVAVYGTTEAEHDSNLLKLMTVAQANGLVFNSRKCIIKAKEIPFFGMIYSADGIKPDPARVESINQLSPPKNAKDLQRFLGIATYMAPFIPNLSSHSSPLRELLKQDTQFEWLPQHKLVFEKIKSTICQATILSYFDPSKKTVLQVDSSLHGLGAVLMQDGKPIAFASKTLTETESRYANIERELLAVVFGCERFHTYLYGNTFQVVTDHKPLEMIHLKNLHAAPPRLQRMLLRLQSYQLTITYQPGKTLLLADGLSRLETLKTSHDLPITLDVRINLIQFSEARIQQLREETSLDPELAPLRELIVNGWPELQREVSKILRPYWSYRDELSIEDGVILKGSEQVVIPKNMQQYALAALHSGHQGRDKCRLRAKSSIFWNGITADIENYISQCQICQQTARSPQKEPLLQKDIPPHPWHTLSSDLFELDGYEYLLVVDHYTKYPFIKMLGKSCTSNMVIQYLRELFGMQGIPEILYSDNGPQYSSWAFKQFSKQWCFKHITSSPGYPQSNGYAERFVQTVKKTLKKADLDNMDRNLALLCLRTTPISDHIKSPFELLMGRKGKANLPVCIRNSLPDADNINAALQARQETQKHYHDKQAGHEKPCLYPGQSVYYKTLPGSWQPGKIIQRCHEPRSYVLEQANGGALRRTRAHIREQPTRAASNTRVAFREPLEEVIHHLPSTSVNNPEANCRRSGRVTKPPTKLNL